MARLVNRIVTLGFVAALAACTTTRGPGVKNTSKTFSTVVVDAGHGGKDSGAYRRYGPPEKMIALDVAQRLNRKLRESQLKTVMTRNSDVFIELNDRVAIENAQKAFDLANQIQAKLMTIPNSANGGVHTANFRVLRLASCPAVLVECGYLSNRSEGNKTRDWEYRELLADRIAEAIVEQRFGSGVYRASTQVAAQPQPQAESSSGGTAVPPPATRR